MNERLTARSWWRWSRPSIVAFLVALAIGVALGLLVNVISPNPTYGLQLEADGLAILIVLIVAVIPAMRHLLPPALGLAVGVIAGVAIGMPLVQPPSPAIAGTVDLKVGLPESFDTRGPASCIVVDGKLASLMTPDEGALRLADGRWVSLLIEPQGDQEPTALDRALNIVVTIRSTLPDGSPTETRMASVASSTISISNAGPTGSMAFQGLALSDKSEQRVPIDVAGSVTWDCVP